MNKKELFKQFMFNTVDSVDSIEYDYEKEDGFSLMYVVGRGIMINEMNEFIIKIKNDMFACMLESCKKNNKIKRCGFIDLSRVRNKILAGWYYVCCREGQK